MSRNNFIDKRLIGLKGNLDIKPLQIKNINQFSEINENSSDNPPCKSQPETRTATVTDQKTIDKLNKEYSKALLNRKDDYFRTKQLVINTINNSLNKIALKTANTKNQLNEMESIAHKLTENLSAITEIDEKSWDKNEFAVELADAVKIVERARLGQIVLASKSEGLLDDKKDKQEKQEFSMYEFNSLTPWQIIRFGFKFFLPLNVGIILAAIIIALAIFITMGIL